MGDLASIIESFSGGRARATEDWAAQRRRTTAGRQSAVAGLAGDIAQIPSLLQKRKEDDEEKSVADAFMGSLAQDGDPKNAARAVQLLAPTLKTLRGSRAALHTLLQSDTMEKERRTAQWETQKHELETGQRQEIGRIFSTPQPQPSSTDAAMSGALPVTGGVYDASPMPQMATPTFAQGQRQYLASGMAGPSDLTQGLTYDRALAGDQSRQDIATLNNQSAFDRAALTSGRIERVASANREASHEDRMAAIHARNWQFLLKEADDNAQQTRQIDATAKNEGARNTLKKEIAKKAEEAAGRVASDREMNDTAKAIYRDQRMRGQFLVGAVAEKQKYLAMKQAELRKAKLNNPDADYSEWEHEIADTVVDLKSQMGELEEMAHQKAISVPVFGRDTPQGDGAPAAPPSKGLSDEELLQRLRDKKLLR